jgi:hypothetical protein
LWVPIRATGILTEASSPTSWLPSMFDPTGNRSCLSNLDDDGSM